MSTVVVWYRIVMGRPVAAEIITADRDSDAKWNTCPVCVYTDVAALAVGEFETFSTYSLRRNITSAAAAGNLLTNTLA